MTQKRAIATSLGSMIAATWGLSWLMATGPLPMWVEFSVVCTVGILWVGITFWYISKTE